MTIDIKQISTPTPADWLTYTMSKSSYRILAGTYMIILQDFDESLSVIVVHYLLTALLLQYLIQESGVYIICDLYLYLLARKMLK